MVKKIEGLRSSNNANLKGTIYFFARQIDRGTSIDAQVTEVDYGVWDKPDYLPGGRQIATFEEKLSKQ